MIIIMIMIWHVLLTLLHLSVLVLIYTGKKVISPVQILDALTCTSSHHFLYPKPFALSRIGLRFYDRISTRILSSREFWKISSTMSSKIQIVYRWWKKSWKAWRGKTHPSKKMKCGWFQMVVWSCAPVVQFFFSERFKIGLRLSEFSRLAQFLTVCRERKCCNSWRNSVWPKWRRFGLGEEMI